MDKDTPISMTTAATLKDDLRRKLDDSREKTRAALSGIDPQKVVYADTGWRVKDLIGHLLAWELEVTTSLRAYAAGKEYVIPGFTNDEVYNASVYERYRDVPFDQLRADWEAVRAGMISAIRAIPPERLDGQIMCPWKLYSDLNGIVRDMINHEAEHLQAILNQVD
jgi:hypothetical protein